MSPIIGYFQLLKNTASSSTAREAGIVMGGNLGSALLRFAVSVVLANQTTKEEFAYLALFMAVMDLSTIAADVGLNNTLVRYMALDREADLRPLLRRSLAVRMGLWTMLMGLAALGYFPFFATQDVAEGFGWMYPAAVASGVFISVSGHGMSIMQGLRRFWSFATLALSVNVLRLAGVMLALAAGFASTGSLFAVFFFAPALTIPLALVWIQLVPRSTSDSSASVPLPEFLRFMAPIGAVSLLAIILQRTDVFLLQALDGPDSVADFRVAYELAFVFPLMARSLFTVLLPRASAMTTAAELAAYQRRAIALYPALLGLVAVAVLLGPWLIQLIFGERYASSAPVVRVLLIAFGMNIIFNPISLILYTVERHIIIPLIHLAQLPLLIGLNLWLIPLYGGLGAAASALIIRILGVAAVIIFTQRAIVLLRRRESNAKVETDTP